MRTTPTSAFTFLLLLASACASVSTTPSGRASAPAKDAGCYIEFFRSKVPDRPYDELAGLHGAGGFSAGDLQELMRAKACELGADAVIITRDFVPGSQTVQSIMTGTAVKYRGAPSMQPTATAQ